MKKNIVIISGGNGSGVTILACKTFLDVATLSAVIPMSDSGGSTGRLRKEFDCLPMSDLMRATIAMSRYNSRNLKQIFFKNRFANTNKLDGHNLGNLFFVLASQYGGSMLDTLEAFHQSLETVGRVYPSTIEMGELVAEYEDGTHVVGEDKIDRPEQRESKIAKVTLDPMPTVFEGAKNALEAADVIILGPGSLYCSIIPSLLVDGVKDIIAMSSAKLVFIAGNAYETIGEAGPETLSGMVSVLESYLPRSLDYILYNNHRLTEEEEKKYDEKSWALIGDDMDDSRVIKQDFERAGGGLDTNNLGAILKNIVTG